MVVLDKLYVPEYTYVDSSYNTAYISKPVRNDLLQDFGKSSDITWILSLEDEVVLHFDKEK